MWISEEEAKTKWCPFYKVNIGDNENCIADKCIMWQKRKPVIADYHVYAQYQPDGSYLVGEFGMKKIKEMEKMGYCKMARDCQG